MHTLHTSQGMYWIRDPQCLSSGSKYCGRKGLRVAGKTFRRPGPCDKMVHSVCELRQGATVASLSCIIVVIGHQHKKAMCDRNNTASKIWKRTDAAYFSFLIINAKVA